MEESITVEVMLNDENADDNEGGNDGFSSSDARMFGGLGMSSSGGKAGGQSQRVSADQSGVVVAKPPHQLLANKGVATGDVRASVISCSDSEDVSDVSSDVSSRLSPLTPSPDFTLFFAQGAQGSQGGLPVAKQSEGARKGLITVAGADLSASSHAIDETTDEHLQLRRETKVAHPTAATTPASEGAVVSNHHLLISEVEDEAPPPPPSPSQPPTSLFRRLKNIIIPEGPPGPRYIMTEEELGHMTVTNILYFTGAVILIVLVYVLYADAF